MSSNDRFYGVPSYAKKQSNKRHVAKKRDYYMSGSGPSANYFRSTTHFNKHNE